MLLMSEAQLIINLNWASVSKRRHNNIFSKHVEQNNFKTTKAIYLMRLMGTMLSSERLP
jgi:hypothetical protein